MKNSKVYLIALAVVVLGVLAYFLVGSDLQTSVLESDRDAAREQFDEDSAWLDEYDVSPEMVGSYVEDNATGYFYEEDGILYAVEGE
jgi:hypothetical protein